MAEPDLVGFSNLLLLAVAQKLILFENLQPLGLGELGSRCKTHHGCARKDAAFLNELRHPTNFVCEHFSLRDNFLGPVLSDSPSCWKLVYLPLEHYHTLTARSSWYNYPDHVNLYQIARLDENAAPTVFVARVWLFVLSETNIAKLCMIRFEWPKSKPWSDADSAL